MSRVVVVGAGLGGLLAAIRLADAGNQVTLIAKGLGGLPLSQGTIDVFGRDGRELVREPWERLRSVRAGHPYAQIGAESVREGLAYLRDLVGPEFLVGDGTSNLLLPTAVGALRPTALVPPSMLAGAARPRRRWLIAGFELLKDFSPALVAENLNRTELPGGGRIRARAVTVRLAPRPGEANPTAVAFARAFDTEEFRDRVVAALRPDLDDAEAVGLPAVLGLADAQVWRRLADALDCPVFEIPLPPPSVPGLRLDRRLRAIAADKGVRFVAGVGVVGFDADGGRVTAIRTAAAGRPRRYPGDAFVLATGGFESGALELDSYGTVTETLFGLPLQGLDAGPLVHGDYWGAEQPLFSVGVRVGRDMRVVDAAGVVVHPNLFAAGGIIGGSSRWAEKSGDGIAVGSAVRAADSIVEVLA